MTCHRFKALLSAGLVAPLMTVAAVGSVAT